ncbi:hypothetical protein EII18_03490 [Comamonadaceae bacterium OH3737_COT-264]|nr:hypothetical protein EII18_03490 [Comamonadaceae bacterium OH3737_COT-264]
MGYARRGSVGRTALTHLVCQGGCLAQPKPFCGSGGLAVSVAGRSSMESASAGGAGGSGGSGGSGGAGASEGEARSTCCISVAVSASISRRRAVSFSLA